MRIEEVLEGIMGTLAENTNMDKENVNSAKDEAVDKTAARKTLTNEEFLKAVLGDNFVNTPANNITIKAFKGTLEDLQDAIIGCFSPENDSSKECNDCEDDSSALAREISDSEDDYTSAKTFTEFEEKYAKALNELESEKRRYEDLAKRNAELKAENYTLKEQLNQERNSNKDFSILLKMYSKLFELYTEKVNTVKEKERLVNSLAENNVELEKELNSLREELNSKK